MPNFDATQASYESLRSIVAERTTPLAVWCGSGLSRPAGLPNWFDLKEELVVRLEQKADSFEPAEADMLQATAYAIRAEQNYWVSFQRLRDGLGRTSFRDSVRELLTPAVTTEVPNGYDLIWRLRPGLLINLNLDRLATRALSQRHSVPPLEFSGHDVVRLRQHLHSPRELIANLHGIADDEASWVLTHDQLRDLYADAAYSGFVETVFSTYSILFTGMSVYDRAVGSHLARLAELKIETPTHFWITSERGPAADKWAEEVGVRLIRYEAEEDDHGAFLECLTDLASAMPVEDEDAPPIAPTMADATVANLPAVAELLRESAETIRRVLNSHAKSLLADDSEDSFARYERFVAEYDEAIYQAWYASAAPGSNTLLGYTLLDEVARGAFGRVFRAKRDDSTQLAIKVLREDIRREGDLLRTFRRGVRSMRILQEHEVEGMVAYRDASEIPAFVVMDWIEGPNLNVAVESRYLPGWGDVLRIGVDLARILRDAHFLPERVLHRDLRPSNIMLANYYVNSDDWSVVVLDFDLSWHRDAYEQSVLHTTAAGYLAPEQIRAVAGASTRHAAVDSFGLGMTLYFMCSGDDPLPDQQRHIDWHETVTDACSSVEACEWLSLPTRFARLILAATRDAQSERWDMSAIGREISQLEDALRNPQSVTSVELLTEEIAARCYALSDYRWDEDHVAAVRSLPTGLNLSLSARLKEERIALVCEWGSTGAVERQTLKKYLSTAATTADGRLRGSGWNVEVADVDWQTLRIAASIDAKSLAGRYQEAADDLSAALEPLGRIGGA